MTRSKPTPTDIATALQHLNVAVTRVNDNVVDFEHHAVPGIAHLKDDRVRTSFFLDFDAGPDDAAAFAARHNDAGLGEVQVLSDDGGTVLRLLRELDPDNLHADLAVALDIARYLHTVWHDGPGTTTDLPGFLAGTGIVCPPTGHQSPERVQSFGPWSWGTRQALDPLRMYLFEIGPVVDELTGRGHFLQLSHAGHGANSHGLSLVTGTGPVAAFVQHGYGGAYSDPLFDLDAINATYARLHLLLAAASRSSDVGPLRWLLVYSQFRGVCLLIDLDRADPRTAPDTWEAAGAAERFGSESALLAAVAERLGLTGLDFGGLTDVRW